MDVLFLSVSVGGGHLKAAEALKEYVEKAFPGSRNLIVDTLKYVNPLVDKLVVGGYLRAAKSVPGVYGILYALSESCKGINIFSQTANNLLSSRLQTLIDEFRPSVIVCTHPFPLQMISSLKRRNKINVPAVAVLTDFVNHPLWLHDNIEAYVVSHESLKSGLAGMGVPGQLIHTCGIPISDSFLRAKSKNAARNELGLEDKPTFLVMGGSLGFGRIYDVFLSLVKCKKDLQVVVITGKNQSLKNKLEKCSYEMDKCVKILSYSDRVADFMDASDFIITKPGGMTAAEALVKGLPMLIISPIPGQEERNAHFLLNNGAAVRILGHDNIDSLLHQVMDDPLRTMHMREMAGRLARPNAGRDIVRLLEKLVNG